MNSALTTAGISLLKSNVIASLVGDKGLKDYFEDDFVVGTAMSAHTFLRNDTEILELIAREFRYCFGMAQPDSQRFIY